MRARHVGSAGLLLAVLLVASLPVAAAALGTPLCGTLSAAPATWEHVVWIWFENHGYGQIIGSRDAPFINKTLVPSCALATNYHALAHPSLPNYIAATSGLSGDALAPFHHDCNATGPCRIGATSLFEQAPSWGAYAESMKKPCRHFFTGPYAASHNPAVYYRSLTDCPLHALDLRTLPVDLSADSLPAFVFVTPNMCHSMHNCSVRSGDAWLARIIRILTSSAVYQRGTTAILVTFDEDDGGDNHVATLAVAPSVVPGTRAGQAFTHYSLLRTTEEMLGLDTFLGRARGAHSMRSALHL